MKKIFNHLVFFIFILLVFSGCKKNESNPVNDTGSSTHGSDYLPLTSSQVFNGSVSGSETVYDSLGNITDFSQISNQIYSGTFGVLSVIRGMDAIPVFANDNNHSKLVGYLSNNNGEIIGIDKNATSDLALILPDELEVGKEWIANPQSPASEQCKVKLVEFLGSFTNSAGKTYQNVINLSFTYKDSVAYYYYYHTRDIQGNLYLAKDVGVVGAKTNNYEEVEKQYSQFYSYYKRTKVVGQIGIVD